MVCHSARLNSRGMKDANKHCETFSLIPAFSSLSLFSSPLVIYKSFCPSFFPSSSLPLSLSLSAPSPVSTFVSAVDSASITAKSNLSNLNLAGPPLNPRAAVCLSGAPTNEMCDKATEGVLPGIKTDFCTLKSEQIKNNRGLFVVQRERFSPSSFFPSFLHLFFAASLSLCEPSHITYGPHPAPPSTALSNYLPTYRRGKTPDSACVCTSVYVHVYRYVYTYPWRVCGRRCNFQSLSVGTQPIKTCSVFCLSVCLLISGSWAF